MVQSEGQGEKPVSDKPKKKAAPVFLKPACNFVYFCPFRKDGVPITNSLLVAKWLCQGDHVEVLADVAEHKASIRELDAMILGPAGVEIRPLGRTPRECADPGNEP
ncbi:MAG: hypothetical protein ACLPX9_22440 [Rhodomicrobium sp.]